MELLDMAVTDHPMRLLRKEAPGASCVPVAELPRRSGRNVRTAGVLAASRQVRTPGGLVQYITIEDESGTAEVVLPARSFSQLIGRITTPGPCLLDGRMVSSQGDARFVANDVRPFHERHA